MGRAGPGTQGALARSGRRREDVPRAAEWATLTLPAAPGDVARAVISQIHDLDADAMYIHLADHAIARTAEVDDGTMVDLDPAGQVIGIEVIGRGRSWPLEAIIERFGIGEDDARHLRAYFPECQPLGLS